MDPLHYRNKKEYTEFWLAIKPQEQERPRLSRSLYYNACQEGEAIGKICPSRP